MTITKRDLEQVRNALDDDARDMFLAMTDEERDAILLSMSGSNSNRLALVEKEQIRSREWQTNFERESRSYRDKRERRENSHDDDMLGTTQKILKAIKEADAAKFNYAVWFRDRVLPTLLTGFILALLYVVYGGKLP